MKLDSEDVMKSVFVLLANHVSVEKQALAKARAQGKLDDAADHLAVRVGSLEAIKTAGEQYIKLILDEVMRARTLEEVHQIVRLMSLALSASEQIFAGDDFLAGCAEFTKQALSRDHGIFEKKNHSAADKGCKAPPAASSSGP